MITEGSSSVPCLASLSVASFPGRNECPGIHCCLIVKEERETVLPDVPKSLRNRVRGKAKERTEWQRQNENRREGELVRNGRLVGAAKTSRACRMAWALAEKLEHTGPSEKERVALVIQSEQLATMPESPLGKGKENGKKQAVCPDHKIVRWKRVKHSGSKGRKGWTSQ